MKQSTKTLAKEIFVASISAHYRHGLEPGRKLNLKQIAGESVEAALTFDLTVQAEEDHNAVTAVMQANNAFSQGFVCGRANDSEALAALVAQSPDLAPNFHRGWDEGRKGAGVPQAAE